MERRGTSACFLICKIGISFASITFIGFVLSMYSVTARLADRESLELIARAIISAIEKTDGCPGELELCGELPPRAQHFEVLITGERANGLQTIRVCVTSEAKAERWLVITSVVNGGDFWLSMEDPREIMVRKTKTISLELVR